MMNGFFSWLKRLASSVSMAFLSGFAIALRHPVIILFKWGLNLLMAWLLIKPIIPLLEQTLQNQRWHKDLFTRMDMGFINEFTKQNNEFLQGVDSYQPPLMLLFLILSIYFSGGIFRALWQGAISPNQFMAACSEQFGRLMLVTFLSLTLFFVMVPIPLLLLAKGVITYLQANPDSYGPAFYMWWGGTLFICVFMFSAVWRVHEYARLLTCAPPNEALGKANPFRCYYHAMRFTRIHHVPTFCILVLFVFSQLFLVWMFLRVENMLPLHQAPFWYTWGLGQALILCRITTSLAAHGAHLKFLKKNLDVGSSQPARETQEKGHEHELTSPEEEIDAWSAASTTAHADTNYETAHDGDYGPPAGWHPDLQDTSEPISVARSLHATELEDDTYNEPAPLLQDETANETGSTDHHKISSMERVIWDGSPSSQEKEEKK